MEMINPQLILMDTGMADVLIPAGETIIVLWAKWMYN